jgi:hypothetical protein
MEQKDICWIKGRTYDIMVIGSISINDKVWEEMQQDKGK